MGKRGSRKRSRGQEGSANLERKPRKASAVDVSFLTGELQTDTAIPKVLAASEFVAHTGESDENGLVRLWRSFQQSHKGRDPELVPTAIQLHCWPILQSQKYNLISLAPTGSGKTLAYGLPLVMHARNGENCLVLVPTRELAVQVTKELQRVCTNPGIKFVAIHGGVDRDHQIASILFQKGGLVMAATPGRFLDIIRTGSDGQLLNILRRTKHIVLDEADRLALNKDLAEQIESILEICANPHTICLCSATSVDKIVETWRRWVGDRKLCVVVKLNGMMASSTDSCTGGSTRVKDWWAEIPCHLTQTLHVCAEHKKPKKLLITLHKAQEGCDSRQKPIGIVFFAKIKSLCYLASFLAKENIACAELHSHMAQKAREEAMMSVRSGKTPLLLATDIAARGVHFNNISYVINYDFPGNLEQYVHRCGRAGRNGQAGTVFSFFTRSLSPLVPDVIKLLEASGQWVDPNLRELLTPTQTKLNAKRNMKPARVNDCVSKAADYSEVDRTARKEGECIGGEGGDDDDDDDEFPDLAQRISFSRAGHVSGPSDASEDDELS